VRFFFLPLLPPEPKIDKGEIDSSPSSRFSRAPDPPGSPRHSLDLEKKNGIRKTRNSIAAGATARLEYGVLASAPLQGALEPASVSYSSGEASLSTSSAAAVIYVVSFVDSLLEKALKLGSAATLGAVSTPSQWRGIALTVFLVLAFFFGGSFLKTVKGASKRRSYKKALAEVEKMK
jgi:hypothetical protein